MKQAEINHAVARATGESVRTVRSLGFLVWDPDAPADDDPGPEVLDWDELHRQRNVSVEDFLSPVPTPA